MRNLLIAAQALLVACAAPSSRDAAMERVIPLDLSGVRPAAQFTIGDGPSALATFDTGAMFNFVDMERARAWGLANEGEPRPQFARDGAFDTTISNARLGDVRLAPLRATAMRWTFLPDRVAVLGPNVFNGSLVTLDFEAAELRIRAKPAPTPQGVEYAYGEAPYVMPRIPVRIGGVTVDALLDTGSAYTLLFPLADAERLPLSAPLVDSGRVRGHRGDFPVFDSRIAGVVQVGPLRVENPEVRFTDAVPFANVGMVYLRQLSITLDPEAGRLWVALLE